MSVITVLSVNMVTVNMLLSVFFVSGGLAACPQSAALFITTPEEMEALSGSCLRIPCTFTTNPWSEKFDSKRETFGVWIKSDPQFGHNPHSVVFNSSKTDNMYPMSITGNLREKNCTTLFSSLLTSYSDTYYFRIENRPYLTTYYFRVENRPFLATASCSPLKITVKDSPPSPRIEISGDLREKESVNITCSALTPCPHSPPELTWNLQQDPRNNIEENADRTFTTKIQTTITLSDQHDGYDITCSASYPVNEGNNVTAEERKTLSVSYAPKDTSVSISRSGSWVNLTCSSRANPPFSSFTWFKISNNETMNVSEGRFYSFNVTDEGLYYCEATNNLGHQKSKEIHLNINGNRSLQWGSALAGITVIILICLAVCIWWFKVKHQTPQHTQSQRGDEIVLQLPSKTEENIHYGEINFCQRRPEPSSDSVQDGGQQQDTLYAQVKVSEPANRLPRTAYHQEDLYAQVKKK